MTHPEHDMPVITPDEGPRGDCFALLSEVVRKAGSKSELCDQTAAVLAEHFGAPIAMVSASVGGEQIESACDRDPESHDVWRRLLDTELLEAQARGRALARVYGESSESPKYALLTAPISTGGDAFGAIGLIAGCCSRLEAESASLELRGLAAHIAQAVRAPKQQHHGTVAPEDLTRVFLKAGEYTSIEQFGFALVNNLRSKVGAEQVALGLADHHSVRLLAVSGMDTIKPRSPGVHRVRQAMGECFDACHPIIAQPVDSWREQSEQPHFRIHEQWRAATNGSCVMSIPVMAGERCVAVLSLRRPSDQGFAPEEVAQIGEMVAPLSGAIPLVRRANQNVVSRLKDNTRAFISSAFAPGSYGKKALALAAILLVAWVAVGKASYRVTVPTVVSAKESFIVSTPFAGKIERVLVGPGDPVEAGQAIAQMDTSDLELQRREAMAEFRSLGLQVQQAVAAGDQTGAALSQAQRAFVQTQIETIDARIERATCRALHAGVLIGADPADLEGQVVQVGEAIATIADPATLRLEMLVPERRSADIPADAPVAFLSNARPRDPINSSAGRVPPTSETRNGSTVFVVEAGVPNTESWLRPGMEGVARVEAGSRPVWWVLFNRVIDYVSLEWWPS